jgi:DNA repair exonuclease SbcCD ATPase subunit
LLVELKLFIFAVSRHLPTQTMINLFGRKVPTTKRKVEEEEEDSSIEEIQPVKKKARSEPIAQPVVPAPKPIISVPKPSPIVNSVDESMWKGRLQGKDQEITELKRQLADLQQENMRITSESQKKIEVGLYHIFALKY